LKTPDFNIKPAAALRKTRRKKAAGAEWLNV